MDNHNIQQHTISLSIAELNNKHVMTEKEAAYYIGMNRSFLRQDRMNGAIAGRIQGPVFIRKGRCIRYLKSDLDAWLEKHRIER